MRTLNFRGRTVIAYRVEAVVEVLRIFHAGQELGLAVCLGIVAPVTDLKIKLCDRLLHPIGSSL
ncbi:MULTISPECIES: hypothetical protein [unclassified Sphingopyxis]|uniref:hypothetical protein n=1 Tax=unclassified Sphingopyxis TaxID=2614943 RepID=UPI0012E35C8A|nr:MULTISPECIES: hypothetical protein [unclassified Sphingopyxis]